MPYIDTKDVAAMRKAIKTALPDYKISVTKCHHSSVDVAILSGPIVGIDNVNVYWYSRSNNPRHWLRTVITVPCQHFITT